MSGYSYRIPYPRNFIIDVLKQELIADNTPVINKRDRMIKINSITVYRTRGTDYILNTLTKDEQKLVEMRYKENKGISVLAERLKCGSYFVESELRRILYKMIHPNRIKYIKYDIEKDEDYRLSFNNINELSSIYSDDYVDTLDLSDRVRNSLRRNNLKKVQDVQNKIKSGNRGFKWYTNLRNIGNKSAKEIEDHLQTIDILER